MVILMPIVSGDGGRLAEALGKRRVPVFFDGGAEFYELEEIRAFILLLQLIRNPIRVMTVPRSHLTRMSLRWRL